MYTEKFLQQVHRKLIQTGITNAELRDTCIEIYEGKNEIFKIDRKGGMFALLQKRQIKKVWNSNKVAQNMNVRFDFYDTYFTEINDNGETRLEYDKLHKVIETKTNFYLMIAKNQGWLNEFDEDATEKDIFTDRNGVEKQTDFMNETAYYGYYNDGGTEVLALPYKNRVYDETTEEMLSYDFDVSMYLIRGEYSENTLSNLIENSSLTNKRIKLSIPKFESEFDTSLINLMNNLGVVDAFEDKKADFRKMFDNGNMYLMAALHKTYIKVDEKGTEAAAVTALAGGASSAPPEPIVVKFDTPFTYVIRDDANGEILFMGEYAFVE